MTLAFEDESQFDATHALSPDDTEFYRERLEERRERIVETRGDGQSSHLDLVDLLDPSGDPVDAIESDERAELLLEQIDIALEKLDEGTFGECEACGDDIEHARLLVWPASRTCLGCDDGEDG